MENFSRFQTYKSARRELTLTTSALLYVSQEIVVLTLSHDSAGAWCMKKIYTVRREFWTSHGIVFASKHCHDTWIIFESLHLYIFANAGTFSRNNSSLKFQIKPCSSLLYLLFPSHRSSLKTVRLSTALVRRQLIWQNPNPFPGQWFGNCCHFELAKTEQISFPVWHDTTSITSHVLPPYSVIIIISWQPICRSHNMQFMEHCIWGTRGWKSKSARVHRWLKKSCWDALHVDLWIARGQLSSAWDGKGGGQIPTTLLLCVARLCDGIILT